MVKEMRLRENYLNLSRTNTLNKWRMPVIPEKFKQIRFALFVW